jgi:N-methylhydantoinase A
VRAKRNELIGRQSTHHEPVLYVSQLSIRIGVDIGGTFTDFCSYDVGTGAITPYKVPSTLHAPAEAVGDGLRALKALGLDPASVEYFVHGATIAINTVLQRNGARVALLVTDGFRDLLEIQRLRLAHPFDFNSTRPLPLVPRADVIELDERILTNGNIDRPLDELRARELISRSVADGIEAYAVCLVNSYRNPIHERRVGALVRELAPRSAVTLSVDVWPQIREYERAVATVMNAYTQPAVSSYLERLGGILAELGCPARPYMTKSNGGVMTTDRARVATAEMLLSGPASGVTGAAFVAREAGFSELITLDLGGTSADIAIVTSGTPLSSQEEHIGDFPIIIPTIAVSSIGAGGGSVARVDEAGVLKVGPQSAGADPGPACYGRGGTGPTLTDAFVVAGLVDPDRFLGGRIQLNPALARDAMGALGAKLGLDAIGAARAVIRVATAAMYSEFSSLMSKRGIDPRDFALVAFGGAGALVACALAREFRIPKVLVPLSPGTLCALGALAADVTNDHIHTVNERLDAVVPESLLRSFADMRAQAEDWLRTEGPSLRESLFLTSVDTRYEGQAYEIEVPLDLERFLREGTPEIADLHHSMHERIYAHADRASAIEVVNLRLRVIGRMPKPTSARLERAESAPMRCGVRAVYDEGGLERADVYARKDLRGGHRFGGPAIVDQDDTTVFVPSGMTVEVDEFGNLIVSVRPELLSKGPSGERRE